MAGKGYIYNCWLLGDHNLLVSARWPSICPRPEWWYIWWSCWRWSHGKFSYIWTSSGCSKKEECCLCKFNFSELRWLTDELFLQRRPHVVWMNLHHQAYLEEIACWAGRGDFHNAKDCPDCIAHCVEKPGSPEYRYEECFLPDLVCSSCCVKWHRVHPFHWIQVFWSLAWLKDH